MPRTCPEKTRLNAAALAALELFGIEVSACKLIHYGFNATFRVEDANGQLFALKLITDSPRTIDDLRAELAWCDSQSKAGIPVCRPFSTEPVRVAGAGPQGTLAICNHWIQGRKLPANLTTGPLQSVCGLLQRISGHPLPPGFRLPEYRSVFAGLECRLEGPVFSEASAECQEALDTLWRNQPPSALHFDLHNRNVLRFRRQLIAFDFEYSHTAPPAIEVANTVFYYMTKTPRCDVEAIVRQSFSFEPVQISLTERQFQSLILARKLFFANDLFFVANPELDEIKERYATRARIQAEMFLSTGAYSP